MAGNLLIEELIRRQATRGETNAAFARHLDIPRPSWVLARGEKQMRLGADVLRKIIKVYPDLTPLAGAYLLEGGLPNPLVEDAKGLGETARTPATTARTS